MIKTNANTTLYETTPGQAANAILGSQAVAQQRPIPLSERKRVLPEPNVPPARPEQNDTIRDWASI